MLLPQLSQRMLRSSRRRSAISLRLVTPGFYGNSGASTWTGSRCSTPHLRFPDEDGLSHSDQYLHLYRARQNADGDGTGSIDSTALTHHESLRRRQVERERAKCPAQCRLRAGYGIIDILAPSHCGPSWRENILQTCSNIWLAVSNS